MKFTIITVCYNSEAVISETIDSVLMQTCRDFEYIIKDGCSTDSTLDIIREYQTEMKIQLISQDDTGIYNAMNYAIKHACGDYILFLNSGDRLYDENVLEDIRNLLDKEKPDIIYGNMVAVKNDGTGVPVYYAKKKRLGRLKIALGYTVCHQVIFAKKELFKEKCFDESYKFWADQEWLSYWLGKNIGIRPFDRPIVYYDTNGVSSDCENLDIIREENDRIVKKYMAGYGFMIIFIKKIVRNLRNMVK